MCPSPVQERIEPAVESAIAFLQAVVGDCREPGFAVRFWDGTCWTPCPDSPAEFTVVLKNPGALRRMFWLPSELSLGEAYLYDDFDLEGDTLAFFRLSDRLLQQKDNLPERLRHARLLLKLPAPVGPHDASRGAHLHGPRHSADRDRHAVRFHYDVSNDFYALWLDRRMVYSCAYFTDPTDDLDTAQLRKLDYICRKLRLLPGDQLLDVGCGWGGLVLHAAEQYGARALGITLSPPQAALANQRIRHAGLADRCRVDVQDYRQLEEPPAFDKLASVGMFEHVGEALLPEYFRRAWRLLKPGGVFLNHGIAWTAPERSVGPSFIDKYVFPDTELVPLSTTLRAAEAAGFEVRDVESLREHYALTLRLWLRRLEAHADDARRIAGEFTFRAWRAFMSGCAHGFQTGRLNVYQVLLSKPDCGESRLPLTRDAWYA